MQPRNCQVVPIYKPSKESAPQSANNHRSQMPIFTLPIDMHIYTNCPAQSPLPQFRWCCSVLIPLRVCLFPSWNAWRHAKTIGQSLGYGMRLKCAHQS